MYLVMTTHVHDYKNYLYMVLIVFNTPFAVHPSTGQTYIKGSTNWATSELHHRLLNDYHNSFLLKEPLDKKYFNFYFEDMFTF